MGIIQKAKLIKKIKKSERGQALIEFTAILPMLFGLLFLAMAVAVHFFAHSLTAHLALEGASREGIWAGYGASFASGARSQAAPTFGINPSSKSVSTMYGEQSIFTMGGSAEIPWAPFGLDLTANPRVTVSSPVWEFRP